MAAAVTPPMSTGATTPPIPLSTTPTVKTPPKFAKSARYAADLNDQLDTVDHFAAMRDNDGFIDAVQKAFRAIRQELSGVSECVNRHANASEAHHTSFYNAHGTFKDIVKKSEKLELDTKFDLAKLYAATASVEGQDTRIKALEEHFPKVEKEVERSWNKAFNIEGNMKRTFEAITRDVKDKI